MKYLALSLVLVSSFSSATETKAEKPEPKVAAETEQPVERVKMDKIEVDLSGRYPASGRGGANLR